MEHIQYRLEVLRDFSELPVNELEKATEETKSIFDAISLKLRSTLASLTAPECVTPNSTTSTAGAPSNNDASLLDLTPSKILDALRSQADELRQRAPANRRLLDYCALLELCPFISSNKTISMPADTWRKLASALPVLAALQWLISTEHLSFPYKRFDFGATPQALYSFLQTFDYESRIRRDCGKFQVPNHTPTRLFPFTFDSKYTMMIAKDEDYDAADKLVTSVFFYISERYACS